MLGLRFSRLVHAALASGALALSACPSGPGGDTDTDTGTDTDVSTSDPTTGPDVPPPPPPPPVDVTPPALVGVTLADAFTLRLSFTEPVAAVDTVNPKRFRLSFARGYAGAYGGQAYTTLIDPRVFNGEQVCTPCYYEPYYDPYYCPDYCYYPESPPIDVINLYNDGYDPSVVLARLSTTINVQLCKNLAAGTDPSGIFASVLHLHYADGGLAQITDLAGIPLPALGEQWIKTKPGEYYSYQAPMFSNFNPFLPIPCPIPG